MALAVTGLVLLWAAAVLPVRVFDDERFEDTTTVVGSLPQDVAAVGYLVLCLVATALWGLLWRRPSTRHLTLALVVVGILAAVVVTRPGASDVLLWDGADAQGRPTGGIVRMVPTLGLWIGVAGGLLTAAAGLAARWGRVGGARGSVLGPR